MNWSPMIKKKKKKTQNYAANRKRVICLQRYMILPTDELRKDFYNQKSLKVIECPQ